MNAEEIATGAAPREVLLRPPSVSRAWSVCSKTTRSQLPRRLLSKAPLLNCYQPIAVVLVTGYSGQCANETTRRPVIKSKRMRIGGVGCHLDYRGFEALGHKLEPCFKPCVGHVLLFRDFLDAQIFKILEHRSNRQPGAFKHPRTTHLAGNAFNSRGIVTLVRFGEFLECGVCFFRGPNRKGKA